MKSVSKPKQWLWNWSFLEVSASHSSAAWMARQWKTRCLWYSPWIWILGRPFGSTAIHFSRQRKWAFALIFWVFLLQTAPRYRWNWMDTASIWRCPACGQPAFFPIISSFSKDIQRPSADSNCQFEIDPVSFYAQQISWFHHISSWLRVQSRRMWWKPRAAVVLVVRCGPLWLGASRWFCKWRCPPSAAPLSEPLRPSRMSWWWIWCDACRTDGHYDYGSIWIQLLSGLVHIDSYHLTLGPWSFFGHTIFGLDSEHLPVGANAGLGFERAGTSASLSSSIVHADVLKLLCCEIRLESRGWIPASLALRSLLVWVSWHRHVVFCWGDEADLAELIRGHTRNHDHEIIDPNISCTIKRILPSNVWSFHGIQF